MRETLFSFIKQTDFILLFAKLFSIFILILLANTL